MLKKALILLSLVLFSSTVFAQGSGMSGGGGNGGDYIRMKFIEIGNFILQNYKDNIGSTNSEISLLKLRSTLDINIIKTSSIPLKDNQGNDVDAIGESNKIILYAGDPSQKTGWYGIFSRGDLVEKLVLHEMLRAIGINDDNYIYSSLILDKYDLNKIDNTAYIRWCSESASFIESALNQGVYARTYLDEIHIYQNALNLIEKLISPKHFYFVEASVDGAKKTVKIFSNNKNKAIFLKSALKQIAGDIRYIDKLLKEFDSKATNKLGDHSRHTLSYLSTVKEYVILAESKKIEEEILNIVFKQTYAYMVNSDYAKTKYIRLFAELDSALNSPSLQYKRQALQYIQTLLR